MIINIKAITIFHETAYLLAGNGGVRRTLLAGLDGSGSLLRQGIYVRRFRLGRARGLGRGLGSRLGRGSDGSDGESGGECCLRLLPGLRDGYGMEAPMVSTRGKKLYEK